MVLPYEYAGYYPEEQTETIIDIAKPEAVEPMPPANYHITGPLAEHQKQKGLAETVGESVAGKVGEAAFTGGGPEGTFFEKGLWGLGKGAGAGSAYSAGWGSAMNPIAAAFKGPGAAAATSGATSGMMAAAAPWALPALLGAKMFGLFNKGGAVHANMGGLLDIDMGKFKGPLAGLLPQYKEHGGMSSSSGPLSNSKSVKMEKKETIEFKN